MLSFNMCLVAGFEGVIHPFLSRDTECSFGLPMPAFLDPKEVRPIAFRDFWPMGLEGNTIKTKTFLR